MERYPKTTLVIVIAALFAAIDLLCGAVFIPFDYNSFRSPDPWFHHTLLPLQNTEAKWGDRVYPFFTNSLGLRDNASCIPEANSNGYRYLIAGDSFLEGVGVTWEESVAGLMNAHFNKQGKEVLNAAVVSYSPLFYYLKTKYLIEEKGLHFDHLLVFIDNSDPLNELTYQDFEPYYENQVKQTIIRLKRTLHRRSYLYFSVSEIVTAGRRNPITVQWNRKMGAGMVDETEKENSTFINAFPLWSHDKNLFDTYGKAGLQLAAANMEKLIRLCRQHHIAVTLVIFPWPYAIVHRDVNNMQVGFWRTFAEKHNTGFINLYPHFINDVPPRKVVSQYFIPGDVHWNVNGNRYVAEMLSTHLTEKQDH